MSCTCTKAKRHRDCAYCGATSHGDGKVCGVCKAAGVDGGLIRGTGPRRNPGCPVHRTVARTTIRKNEFGEYHVRAYDGAGRRFPEADCFESDRDAARGTAAAMVRG